VDRNIETVLLPYAGVPQLEEYVKAQNVDGILIWVEEKHHFFRTMPYGNFETFDEALQRSKVFGPAQVSGDWRWYPVRTDSVALATR
jgi:hypothetical protein